MLRACELQVVPELVSRRAMCMDYVPGESLSKAAKRLSQATWATRLSFRCNIN